MTRKNTRKSSNTPPTNTENISNTPQNTAQNTPTVSPIRQPGELGEAIDQLIEHTRNEQWIKHIERGGPQPHIALLCKEDTSLRQALDSLPELLRRAGLTTNELRETERGIGSARQPLIEATLTLASGATARLLTILPAQEMPITQAFTIEQSPAQDTPAGETT